MNELEAIVADCINVEELTLQNGFPVIRGTLLILPDKAFETIAERVKPLNLIPILRKKDEKIELQLRKVIEPPPTKSWINLLLFIATLGTTIIAGALLAGVNPFSGLKNLLHGIPFSFTLLLILGSHEFGHYFTCKKRGIQATLPYFIPVPPPFFPLGTFGAIIRLKAPIQDKKALVAIGAAGPIIGFCFAIPVAILGIQLSELTLLTPERQHLFLGNSFIFWALTKLFTVPTPPGYDLSLHPIAFAGWVGMLVTALNLLPLGQLDGGHISYALLGKNSKFIALPLVGAMLILGLYWPGWIFWALLTLLFIGLKHPPPLNDITPLDTKHKVLGWIALLIFIITFVPIPFQISY